jgi:hypothetical protein
MECTPLHIYFSLDFCLQLPHLCVPALKNLTLLKFGLYYESDVPAATCPQNGLLGKHHPIVILGSAAWQRTQQKNALPHCWAGA